MTRQLTLRTLAPALLAVLLLSMVAWAPPAAAAEVGAVYALSNAPAGNAVLVWGRAADGALTPAGSYPTGGAGTGGGLGSQGAIVLSDNGRWLFAVDAGSNQVAAFRVSPRGLEQTAHVSSGGATPTSLSVSGDLLYVLNAGGSGNISGFRVGNDGSLSPLAGSARPLSGDATAPAQVSFSPDGATLVVTERATQQIGTYAVGADGLASGPTVFASSGSTPFGFAFAGRDQLVVSEANGAPGGSAASSYLLRDGALSLVTGSAPTFQGAACWTVVTKNGRFAYTANAASASISGFSVGQDGSLTLLDANGRSGVAGAGAADMALSVNSQFLYVRNGRDSSISAFAVAEDGSLTPLAGMTGLPAGAAGLAAR
jgi:6-phosphogluconolactonase (cycloisomerase 2 family)